MKKADYKIEELTVAITNMEKMLNFYSNVFNIKFTEKEMYGSTLYSSVLGDLKLLFCPANIANNTVTQNKHQFDIVVNDIQKIITISKQCDGKTIGELVEDEYCKSIGVFDPDNNSIVFKELEKNNSKNWFDENRKPYETVVKKPFKEFTTEIINQIYTIDSTIKIEAKDAITRINRDIRFSKNKTPYNTHVGAIISSVGRKDKYIPFGNASYVK